MVNFMYLGQTEVEQDDLNHFMEVAAKFDVKGLSQEKQNDEANQQQHFDEAMMRDNRWKPQEDEIVKMEKTEIDTFYNDAFANYEHENIAVQVEDIAEKRNVPKSHENAYHCEQCDYKSEDVSNMRRHKKARHEGIKFPCDQCEYKSSYSHDLTKHKRNKHTK